MIDYEYKDFNGMSADELASCFMQLAKVLTRATLDWKKTPIYLKTSLNRAELKNLTYRLSNVVYRMLETGYYPQEIKSESDKEWRSALYLRRQIEHGQR